MQVAAVLLLVHLALYRVMERQRRTESARPGSQKLKRGEGFKLVFASRYLMLMALLLIALNLVNTTGEYILGRQVVDAAAAQAAAGGIDKAAFIGSFYGRYFFWVNVAAVIIQAFVVSRLVTYAGLGGALFALPIVAFGAYGMLATGVTLAITRWAKTLENATDYSAMNTARQMLWLPTTPEEKYQGKQAIDTFFVRTGDLISAGVVFVGTEWLMLSARGFAASMVAAVIAWLALSALLLREYHRLSVTREHEKAA
jgi:AAA family ATP:ADP antiporter